MDFRRLGTLASEGERGDETLERPGRRTFHTYTPSRPKGGAFVEEIKVGPGLRGHLSISTESGLGAPRSEHGPRLPLPAGAEIFDISLTFGSFTTY